MIAQYCLKHFDEKFVDAFSLDGLDLRPGRSHGQFYAS